MKTIKIGTKKQAEDILINSLFSPVKGKTLNKELYSSGKYAPGSYIGREVRVGDNVHALFTESGKDENGAFVRLMCIAE